MTAWLQHHRQQCEAFLADKWKEHFVPHLIVETNSIFECMAVIYEQLSLVKQPVILKEDITGRETAREEMNLKIRPIGKGIVGETCPNKAQAFECTDTGDRTSAKGQIFGNVWQCVHPVLEIGPRFSGWPQSFIRNEV